MSLRFIDLSTVTNRVMHHDLGFVWNYLCRTRANGKSLDQSDATDITREQLTTGTIDACC